MTFIQPLVKMAKMGKPGRYGRSTRCTQLSNWVFGTLPILAVSTVLAARMRPASVSTEGRYLFSRVHGMPARRRPIPRQCRGLVAGSRFRVPGFIVDDHRRMRRRLLNVASVPVCSCPACPPDLRAGSRCCRFSPNPPFALSALSAVRVFHSALYTLHSALIPAPHCRFPVPRFPPF